MQLQASSSEPRRVSTDRGRVDVWVQPPILVVQLSGYGDVRFADPIMKAFDEILRAGMRPEVFFEMGGMHNYDSALRTRLTSHFAAQRSQIQTMQMHTRSRLVSMGIAVANLALGGMIVTHDDVKSLQTVLDRALAAAKIAGLSSAVFAR